MKRAFIDRAISKEAHGHAVFTLVLRGKSHACRDGQLRGNDGVPTKQPQFVAPHMHGTALALAASGNFPEEFGHYRTGFYPLRNGVSMLTIARQHLVFWT